LERPVGRHRASRLNDQGATVDQENQLRDVLMAYSNWLDAKAEKLVASVLEGGELAEAENFLEIPWQKLVDDFMAERRNG
jgi:hypothetical protein